MGQYFDEGNSYQGFLYNRGTFTAVPFPGAISTSAFSINSNRDIVGYNYLSDGVEHGFFLKNGGYSSFDHPQAHDTVGFGINDAGVDRWLLPRPGGLTRVHICRWCVYSSGCGGSDRYVIFRINNKKNVVGYVIDSLGEAHGIIGQSNPQEKLHDSKAASLAINFWTDIFLWSKSSVGPIYLRQRQWQALPGNCKTSRAQESRKVESLVLARLLEGGRLPGSKKIPTLADFSNRFFN